MTEVVIRLVADQFPVRERRMAAEILSHLDTRDWRLLVAGQGLAMAEGESTPVLSWYSGPDRPALRQVVERVPSRAADLPPGPLSTGLTGILAGERLRVWGEVRREGVVVEVLDPARRVVARAHFADRAAREPGAGEWVDLASVVRLEGLRGQEEALAEVAAYLSAELGLRHHHRSDAEDAAEALGLASPCAAPAPSPRVGP